MDIVIKTILLPVLVIVQSRFEVMNKLISAVKLKPVIDEVFGFEEVSEAYEYLSSQKHVGKVVLQVSRG